MKIDLLYLDGCLSWQSGQENLKASLKGWKTKSVLRPYGKNLD